MIPTAMNPSPTSMVVVKLSSRTTTDKMATDAIAPAVSIGWATFKGKYFKAIAYSANAMQ